MIKSYELGMIKDNWMLIKLHENLSEYAMLNGTLFSYTWVNLPLVYTQLVTVAVYVYFYFVALFARNTVIDKVMFYTFFFLHFHDLNESIIFNC